MAAARLEIDASLLIDACDEVAVIRDLVLCICLACSSPILPRDERTALGQLALVVRGRLDALAKSLEASAAAVTSSDDDRA